MFISFNIYLKYSDSIKEAIKCYHEIATDALKCLLNAKGVIRKLLSEKRFTVQTAQST